MENCLREQAERLCEALTGVQGAGPWLPLPKKKMYLVS